MPRVEWVRAARACSSCAFDSRTIGRVSNSLNHHLYSLARALLEPVFLRMSDFFVSLDALNEDPFYQDTRDDLDIDLAFSRLSRICHSSKSNVSSQHHDQEHTLHREPADRTKQISLVLTSTSPSVVPLSGSTSSRSIDLRKLTLLRSLAVSPGSRLEDNEHSLVAANQDAKDDRTSVNQDVYGDDFLSNQTFDQQAPSGSVSSSSPSSSNNVSEQPDHSTFLHINRPILRSTSPVSTQMAFDLLSNVTTPNTSLIELNERSPASPLRLIPSKNALVNINKRSRQCSIDRVIYKEPRHVRRLRLAFGEENMSTKLSDASFGITAREDKGSKIRGKAKSRTGPTLRSLSAVALKLNEALEKRSDSKLVVQEALFGTKPRNESKLNVLAGTTVLIMWKNVESLVNEYQANWIEKISSLGAKIATDTLDNVTHAIPDSSDFPHHLILKRFNVKHIDDLPKSVKFVSDHWIDQSHQTTSRADEEPFLLFGSHRTTFGVGPSTQSPPNSQPTAMLPSPTIPIEPTRIVFHNPTIQY